MPWSFEKIPINDEELDRRVKLTKEDKEEVRRMSHDGFSQREIARHFNVSRRLIVFTLFPERQHVPDWKKYYSTEKRRQYQRTHRAYKRQLIKDGLLKKGADGKKKNV
jgi:IS30 family transposase